MEVDTETFLFLLHVFLLGLYFWEQVEWHFARTKHKELVALLKKERPGFLSNTDNKNAQDALGAVLIIGALHCFAYGNYVDAWPVWLMVVIGVSAWAAVRNENLKIAIEAGIAPRSATAEAPKAEHSFGADHDDDDFFAHHDSEREDEIRREAEARVRREYEQRQTKTPRGFEKRHPDDADLWAKVDDPNANPNERENAARKIFKREAARKAGNGGASKRIDRA